MNFRANGDDELTRTCKLCGKNIRNTQSSLVNHFKIRHTSQPKVKCPYCDKLCKNKATLRTHKSQKHKK